MGGARTTAFDANLLARALDALQRGDRSIAASAFETLQAGLPREPDALHAIGFLGLQLGRNDRAAEILRTAVELNPRQPACRCHLAIAYRRLGRPESAREELEAAIALDPALAEAHSNLGTVLLEAGNAEGARRSFERALAIRAEFPDAFNGLGGADLALGRNDAACASFERAVALDPAFHEAWYNLARARARYGFAVEESIPTSAAQPTAPSNAELALESILTALQLHRASSAYWVQFEEIVQSFDLCHPVDSRLRDYLSQAFDHVAVDPARLVRPIVGMLTTQPSAIAVARGLSEPESPAASAWAALGHDALVLLEDPMLQRMLEEIVVPNAFIQRLVALARRALLRETLDERRTPPSLSLSAIAALAHQSFNTEYVADESSTERTGVERLRGVIETARSEGRSPPLGAYAVYASYRPLHTLVDCERIAHDLLPTALGGLATRQIVEPLEEQRLRSSVATLTAVTDDVSVAVRNQYEANPYPRWHRLRMDAGQVSVAHFLHRRFPHADLHGASEKAARILVAGCGTGRHPVSTAQRFPDARVLAVDLSRTSLAYAMRKTRDLGIGNVEYAQADLLGLGSLDQRFDVIECVGVLHHLRDPVAGWRALCGLLQPGGLMRIGLYSALARRHVAHARALIAEGGFSATPDGIRACRRAILSRQDDPLLARVTRGEDFYSLSGCRDLLFHVQERAYALPEIAAILGDLGLALIGLDVPEAVAARYRDRFPDDPALADLDRWHRFEQQHPDCFAAMYQFWVRAQR